MVLTWAPTQIYSDRPAKALGQTGDGDRLIDDLSPVFAGARDFAGPFGSSGSSLHAKTFAVDGQRLFIGSFNFDPRSANLNTEMGFLIERPTLAQATHSAFEQGIPRRAYQVFLAAARGGFWLGSRRCAVISRNGCLMCPNRGPV